MRDINIMLLKSCHRILLSCKKRTNIYFCAYQSSGSEDSAENASTEPQSSRPGPFQIPISSFREHDLIETGKYFDADPFIFDTKPRVGVLHDIYVWERACARKGNACVRTRGETWYSGKKLRPQVGMGRARIGDRGASHLKWGGKAHGPKPTDYGYNLPKKIVRLGLRMCMTQKHSEKNIVLLNDMDDCHEVISHLIGY
ncbi:50S ribosomal protein L4 [Thelohanellus kitauei]|uniref:Large ribosomal subunit protein uL4m n=1 Tax=Thelohanellus kitauei TaxID=669202 RepID=A0A0C2M735_THEKT|nr:50S ribosomal protein L4 [Thelohanellus kitauei]